MRISDWSSDLCSSDLSDRMRAGVEAVGVARRQTTGRRGGACPTPGGPSRTAGWPTRAGQAPPLQASGVTSNGGMGHEGGASRAPATAGSGGAGDAVALAADAGAGDGGGTREVGQRLVHGGVDERETLGESGEVDAAPPCTSLQHAAVG